MVEVRGDDGQPDYEVSLSTLCSWTGYSNGRLLQLAKAGVVRRQGRNRYLLRASISGLFQRARERNQDRSLDQILTVDLGSF